MNKWGFKLTVQNILKILVGTVINLGGRWLAGRLTLPIWLDSVGTFLVAVILGPVAGALSGALMNVITAVFEQNHISFMLVSVAGGLAVGRFFPRDRKIDSFSAVATALFAGIVMTIVSTPLNIIFNNGYTGNAWGDALVDLTSNYINGKAFCCLLGGLLVNMPDKALSIGIALFIIWTGRKRIYKGNKKDGSEGNDKDDTSQKDQKDGVTNEVISVITAAIALPVLTALLMSANIYARPAPQEVVPDLKSDYAGRIFTTDDGLISMEINTVEQTRDGYIWVGSYSGLYRYNGTRFEKVALDERINNVIYIYEDDSGRLWIGTNDSGVACYDIASGDIKFYTTAEGLPSDSVRSICEDDKGNMYISTIEELVRIDASGDIHVYDHVPGVTYLYSLNRTNDGNIAGVTSKGIPVIISGDEILTYNAHEGDDPYTVLACDDSGNILLGTSTNELCLYHRNSNEDITHIKTVRVHGVNYINCIAYSARLRGYIVCATTGLAFVDEDLNATLLSRDGFSNSTEDAIVDYQDNIWIVSSQQGILKLSYNPFSRLFVKADIAPAAVNALLLDGTSLYAGTDTGLIMINIKTEAPIRNMPLTRYFDGVRIRNLMKDSEGNIWVSTYGPDGLVVLSPDLKEKTIYNSMVNKKVLGTRFRFTMELDDGVVLAASTEGLNYIKNGEIIGTIGASDGLHVPQILSATLLPEGQVLAGSDGDGIYIIEDMKVTGHIGPDEGLMSQVVLRIVQCGEGRIYVTSNGLYYGSADKVIRKLAAFPYSNNYDVYVADNGEAWISSSAGIYVVDTQSLVEDEGYDYVLLNRNRGLDTTLTANAWNASGDGRLYLCCTDGVRVIYTAAYDELNDNYNIVLSKMTDDDETVPYQEGRYILPPGRGRIRIEPAVLSYTLANPLISVSLEGVDDVSDRFHQSDMTDISYNSIPYGDHELKIRVLDELDGSVKKEQVFYLHKEAELYERLYYKLYLIFVGTMLVAFLAWMIAKMGNMAVINRQYDQIREAKEEAEYANRAKSQFLANMSHEIRTPINTVLGMDEMILRESMEPAIRGYASDIYTAGNTLLSLINDILDSSKIESGKMEIVPVDYELATLIRDLMNMISKRAKDKDLVFKVEVDDNLPSRLHGDDVRIRQVVTNILTNAVKYTPEGFVTMRVTGVTNDVSDGEKDKAGRKDEACVDWNEADNVLIRFEVEDTGIGIKEEDLPKLFEEFQRIEEGRNRNIEGTGLGMNITMQLLKLMDSTLEVRSEYGKGSLFWFDLNQQVVDADPIGDFNEKLSAPDESYNHKGAFIAPDARVLVVDDNDMNRKVFKSLLKVTQINISDASSGARALEFAENVRYDMVFMDHMMPDMDGVETMKRMRQIKGYENVPIYVLTANAVTGAREQYLEAGFDGFVSKPVVSDKLEQALREGLPERLVIPIEDADEGSNGAAGSLENPMLKSVDDLPMIDGVDWNFAWLHLPDMELLESSVVDFCEGIRVQADKLDRMYDEIIKTITGQDIKAGTEADGGVIQMPVNDINAAEESSAEDDAMSAYRIRVHAMKSSLLDDAMSAYRIQVHAMKSSAAMIGIVPLAGMAKILEFAARDHDADTIRQMHNVFVREWRSYTDKLTGVFGLEEGASGNEDKERADDEMLGAMLEMLFNALEDFDVDACDDIMKQIRSYSYDEDTQTQVEELAGAVTDLDTDMAEDIINKIRDNMWRKI